MAGYRGAEKIVGLVRRLDTYIRGEEIGFLV